MIKLALIVTVGVIASDFVSDTDWAKSANAAAAKADANFKGQATEVKIARYAVCAGVVIAGTKFLGGKGKGATVAAA